MEIAFSNLSIRTICEDEAHAKKELDPEVAEVLKRRLADLRAARSVTDLATGQPHPLHGADNRHMAVELCNRHRLVICANHAKNPIAGTGELDWPKVTRIKILGIEHTRV